MTQKTIYVYTEHNKEDRTYWTENAYPMDMTSYTPVYLEDGYLVIKIKSGTIKIDRESIIRVTKEVLERNGIDEDVTAPPVNEEPSDAVLDINNIGLYDADGIQIRVKES